MSKQLDYIIVGQGIAGSMVAHFLLQKGKKEQSEKLVIGYFNDARVGQEKFADLIISIFIEYGN
jgi:hypothetical protein